MATQIDLNNIQGDVYPSLPKKTETFFFFKFAGDIGGFKADLAKFIPLITTGAKVNDDRSKISEHKRSGNRGLVEVSGLNISFSKRGIDKLGIIKAPSDESGDTEFVSGMLADAKNLGDKGTVNPDGTFAPAWDPGFVRNDVDGVILVTGDCQHTVARALENVKDLFHCGRNDATIIEAFSLVGNVRPGAEEGHEHFGFEDGISQPAIAGLDTTPNKGQVTVPPGVVFCGRDGDNNAANAPKNPGQKIVRPDWALDGSFLCFRKLAQLVPEFDEFCAQNALPVNDPSLPADHGKELLGARLVGRWKSGAPIELTPLVDDPNLAGDASRNNDFDFSGDAGLKCPFSSHIRKTNPRSDFATRGLTDPAVLTAHLFPRRGIPYGPEVSPEEAKQHKTSSDRGLLFVCYQSNLSNGFRFVQTAWSNTPGFIFSQNPQPGFDPIIGQNSDDAPRTLTGASPNDPTATLNLGSFEWVVSKGGAYFFTPTISSLNQHFANAAAPALKVQG